MVEAVTCVYKWESWECPPFQSKARSCSLEPCCEIPQIESSSYILPRYIALAFHNKPLEQGPPKRGEWENSILYMYEARRSRKDAIYVGYN